MFKQKLKNPHKNNKTNEKKTKRSVNELKLENKPKKLSDVFYYTKSYKDNCEKSNFAQ